MESRSWAPGRALILLAVTTAIATAAPASAESYRRTSRDGTIYFTNLPANAAYGRASLSPVAVPAALPLPRDDRGTYAREIADASGRYAVPERLIWAVIRAESGFDPRAQSDKGAQGLMQLMPRTASILGVRDSFNPRENIDAGVRHLRALLMRFEYNVRLAVAAYNAGERAVVAYGDVPPYPETREYVTRVMRFYGTPIAWGQPQVDGVYQIIQRNGTIVYTNIPRPVGR